MRAVLVKKQYGTGARWLSVFCKTALEVAAVVADLLLRGRTEHLAKPYHNLPVLRYFAHTAVLVVHRLGRPGHHRHQNLNFFLVVVPVFRMAGRVGHIDHVGSRYPDHLDSMTFCRIEATGLPVQYLYCA